jgi:hypothetical protein
MMVTQAVIEKIALPFHAVFSSDKLLPVPDRCLHARVMREGNNGVQVIRHKQAQLTMLEQSLVVEFHGCKHGIAGSGSAELVFARRHAVNGYEKPTALGHPLRNRVRQLFANGQSHASSITRRSRRSKAKKR